MANINEVFPSDYLKADDFGGIEGAPVLAEISHTTIERMKDNTDKIWMHTVCGPLLTALPIKCEWRPQ